MKQLISQRALTVFGGLLLASTLSVAQASPVSFTVPLTGAQQVPPVETSGSGNADLTYDAATHVMTWNITFSGLSSQATSAHLHGPAAAGKNGGVLVWITPKGSTAPVTSPLTGKATLSEAEAKSLEAGNTYINVHTQTNASGEIRGQVVLPGSN